MNNEWLEISLKTKELKKELDVVEKQGDNPIEAARLAYEIIKLQRGGN